MTSYYLKYKWASKDLEVTGSSMEQAWIDYRSARSSLPKDSINIKSELVHEEEYGYDKVVIKINYYVPKTENDFERERDMAAKERENKRLLLEQLKKELGES